MATPLLLLYFHAFIDIFTILSLNNILIPHICILPLLNSMQENFRAQRISMLNRMYNGGVNGTEAPEASTTAMRKLCQKAAKNELCKQGQQCCAGFPCEPAHPHEGFDACTPNEGCAVCNVSPEYRDRVVNPSNTRQFNIPSAMHPSKLLKVAGGAPEKFSGKIDASKYGNYGTSMLQPVETFQAGASNARLNGAAMDMSWASGTMDAICRRGIQPFSPQRYGQYRA